MIHCGKIPIYCAKSPIQCKITCCGQNCTLNVWLHHENHTLSCTFSVNYTTFVKYMDHFHVQSRKFYTWQKKFTQAPQAVTNMRYAHQSHLMCRQLSEKMLYCHCIVTSALLLYHVLGVLEHCIVSRLTVLTLLACLTYSFVWPFLRICV